MEVKTNTITTILLLGAAQGFFLAVVLASIQRGNRIANRFLALILLLFSASIVMHASAHTSLSFYFPYHRGIVLIFFMIVAPLLYFYVLALTLPDFEFRKRNWFHFFPVIVGLVLTFIQKPIHDHTRNAASGEGVNLLILAILVIIQTIIYVVAAIKALLSHSKTIKESFSSIEKINLNWLRFLIIGYVITWFVALFVEGLGGGTETWNYYWILVSVFMYAIGYMGLWQPEIFSGGFPSALATDQTNKSNRNVRKKYEKSTLTSEQAEVYFERLQHTMANEKPYLESNLTLPELAKKLSIPTHHLSQIINEKLQQNFFEFINRHRVEEAKKLLTDPKHQHKTIAAIGFEAGFNSISAFNTAFKKHTGKTPSQFRKLLKKKD